MTRHCIRCDAEVEDTGGYCLLGHPLRHTMETSSLAELKDEVDSAFAEAEDEVRDALAPLIEQVEAVAPAPEPALAAVAAAPQTYESSAAPTAPAAFHAPSRPTPPPPPPQRPKGKYEALWDGMDELKPLDQNDPINAFAPPPRMDWGPSRGRSKGRSLRRLRASQA